MDNPLLDYLVIALYFAVIIGAGGVVAYSVAGSMWSITLTDYLQFLVMTVGIFFLLFFFGRSRRSRASGARETRYNRERNLSASYLHCEDECV